MTDLDSDFSEDLDETQPAGQSLDAPDDWEDDANEEELYVNFSSEEAASKALEALPSGKYNVEITKVELRQSQSAKNPGKPMYNLSMRVIDGKYAKRTVYGMVMLWAGAAYSLNQLMVATGFPTQQGQVKVPTRQQLVGKTLTIRGLKKPADEVKGYDERFEVKGYMPLQGAGGDVSSSLEP